MSTLVFRQLDANGNVLLDLTKRTFLTLADVATNGSAGSVTIPTPPVGGNVVWAMQATGNGVLPTISHSGNTVSWTSGQAGRLKVMMF